MLVLMMEVATTKLMENSNNKQPFAQDVNSDNKYRRPIYKKMCPPFTKQNLFVTFSIFPKFKWSKIYMAELNEVVEG